MTLSRRQTLAGLLAPAATPALWWPGSSPAQAVTAATGPAQALHALFERYWDDTARWYPEWATFRGDHRYGDRLTDRSPEADADRIAQQQRWLAQAEAVPRDALSVTDRVSRDMFIHEQRAKLRLHAFEGWRTMEIGALRGTQTALADLLKAVPMDSAERAEQLLARLAAYPRAMDQAIAKLSRGVALGWVPPQSVVQRALSQIDGQLAPALRQGPFFEPFGRLPSSLPAGQRAALMARGEAAIESQVLPAMVRLREFLQQSYLIAAPASGGLLRYPDGAALYAELVAQHTTTQMAPQQIHQMGLDLLDQLHVEIRKVQKERQFNGSFAQWVALLNQPQHFFSSPEAMLEGLRAAAKRLDPEMPRLFAELPRATYGIRAMPVHLGPGAADNYNRPPEGGAQPGWYNANTLAFTSRQRWALPTLVAHETVPGHHLQGARAIELGGLPAFRRNGFYTAFGEGWALYAETLCDELGLFDSPETRFGYLQAQAFRAARLVVDTGLHSLGWSRQQAIDLMIDRSGQSAVFVQSEVDRYLSNPGQALAYMVGQQHILGLRARARHALGAGFDLRRFNNAVIDQGALPLDVLTSQIDNWTKAE